MEVGGGPVTNRWQQKPDPGSPPRERLLALAAQLIDWSSMFVSMSRCLGTAGLIPVFVSSPYRVLPGWIPAARNKTFPKASAVVVTTPRTLERVFKHLQVIGERRVVPVASERPQGTFFFFSPRILVPHDRDRLSAPGTFPGPTLRPPSSFRSHPCKSRRLKSVSVPQSQTDGSSFPAPPENRPGKDPGFS